MPEVTPPQIAGLMIGGIPIIAEALRAFGVYDLSLEQQDALSNAVTWATVLGGALIGGDAILRTGRNLRRGQVEAAAVEHSQQPPSIQQPPMADPPTGTTYQPPSGFE